MEEKGEKGLEKMGGPNNLKDSHALIGFRLSLTRPLMALSRGLLGTFDLDLTGTSD